MQAALDALQIVAADRQQMVQRSGVINGDEQIDGRQFVAAPGATHQCLDRRLELGRAGAECAERISPGRDPRLSRDLLQAWVGSDDRLCLSQEALGRLDRAPIVKLPTQHFAPAVAGAKLENLWMNLVRNL